jgi:hypothetical protein
MCPGEAQAGISKHTDSHNSRSKPDTGIGILFRLIASPIQAPTLSLVNMRLRQIITQKGESSSWDVVPPQDDENEVR